MGATLGGLASLKCVRSTTGTRETDRQKARFSPRAPMPGAIVYTFMLG